jgi:hypothetical protein
VADLLTRVRREIDARLAELRPVVTRCGASSAPEAPSARQPALSVSLRCGAAVLRSALGMTEAQSRNLDRQVLALLSRIRHSGRLRLRCCRRPRLRACVPGSSDSLTKERSVSKGAGPRRTGETVRPEPEPSLSSATGRGSFDANVRAGHADRDGHVSSAGRASRSDVWPTPKSVSARRHGMSGARGA